MILFFVNKYYISLVVPLYLTSEFNWLHQSRKENDSYSQQKAKEDKDTAHSIETTTITTKEKCADSKSSEVFHLAFFIS